MMILDTTSKTIQAVLGGAVTTNQLRITSHFEDITTTTYVPGSNRVVTNNTTAVTVVGSPAASTQRKVLSISIYNKDTADAAVTVQAYDGTNTDELVKVTLDPGDTLYYGNHAGWIVTDSAGRVKTVTGTGSTEPSDGDKGDITVSASGLTWTIDTGVVTLAKIVDATGQYKIMARATAGAGEWEELSSSSNVFSILAAADYADVQALLFSVKMPENTSINLEGASSSLLSADGKYLGITEKGYAGTALTFGDLCYLQTSDLKWEKTSAAALATCSNKIGVCVQSASEDASTLILLFGKVRAASFPVTGLMHGAAVYVSTTSGEVTSTAPSSPNYPRKVGWANASDELFFFPSNEFEIDALLQSNNLSDLDSTATALTNLFGTPLPENTAIQLDAALSADGKYSGIVLPSQTAGAALAFGDLCYLQTSDSRWELADADAESTCSNMLGICVLAAAGDGSATTILIFGKVRADTAFPTMTIGANMFVSTTAGDIQTTAPSGTADIIRIVGQAVTADELYFNPSNDYYEHA